MDVESGSRMCEALDDAYAEIIEFEPLDESADEVTRDNLPHLHRLAALLLLHTSGLLEASGVAPEPQVWEEVGARFDPPEVEITPESRFEAITEDDRFNTAIYGNEWVHEVIQSQKKGKYAAEQEGFLRLFRGYEPACSVAIMLEAIGSDAYDGRFNTLCQTSLDIEGIADVSQCLISRDVVIDDMGVDTRLQEYVRSVLCTIQGLRFAYEWEGLGRAKKTHYRSEMFDKFYPDWRDFSEALLKRQKKSFQSRHDKVIKGRKDVKLLFEKFGIAVLMDSTWTPKVSYHKGTTGRTDTFPGTLRKVLEKGPEGERYHEANQETFEQLMEIIGGPVKDYVAAFIQERRDA